MPKNGSRTRRSSNSCYKVCTSWDSRISRIRLNSPRTEIVTGSDCGQSLHAPIIFVYINRTLNFENINYTIFAVIDWNYAAYSKVRDQEVGVSNPLAPTTSSLIFIGLRFTLLLTFPQ